MNVARLAVATLVVICVCMGAGTAFGQSAGTISGTITDSSGAVIPGVTVTALNQGTGITRSVITGDGGRYVFSLLPIGIYTVSASLTGFQTTETRGVALEVQQNRTLNITLKVAAIATEVTVSSQVAEVELQRSDATLGQLIHSEQVSNLPLNGRNFVQLALLGAGTAEGRAGSFMAQGPSSEVSYRGSMSVSAQGMRENANDWLYDGIDNNELSAGGISILPSIDSIAEFRVLTYNFSAQYGSRGGTTVLVSSKSGTNSLHGTLFEYHRNDVLDARNFFDGPQKGKYIQNQYGFSLGGPILKDRTFFFGGFEGNNIRQGLTRLNTVPTALMRQGNFTESFSDAPMALIYDPASTRIDPVTGRNVRDQFPGNIIPTNRIDPIGKKLVELFPLPTTTERLGTNYLSNPVKTLNNYQFHTRVDHEISASDKLFVRFSFEDGEQYLPTGLPGFAASGSFSSNQTFTTDARNLAVSHTHIFPANTVNQLTAGYNRVFNYITSFGYLSNKSQELGIPGANLGGNDTSSLTRMSFQNFAFLGDRGFSPFQGGTNVYHLSDTLSVVRGSHTLNMGFTSRFMQLNLLGDDALAGRFVFDRFFTAGFTSAGSLNSSTGSSIASLLLGLPTSGGRNNQLNGSVKGRRWKEYRGFIDDTWKLGSDLTLTLGFAYAVTTPQSEAAERFSNFDFYTGKYTVGGTGGVKTDYSNIQPRFGFAWSPFGSRSTVLRGGYGIFHDVSAVGGSTGPVQNPPYANAYAFTSDNITPVRTLSTGFPDNSKPVDPAVYTGTWHTIDPNYKQGRIQQWNLNVERMMPGSVVFMASYAGTYGDRLFNKGRNLNTATLGTGFNPAARRRYPNLQDVNVALSRSWLEYHSMQLRVERRAAKGGYVLASYTFSKALTNGQSGLGGDPGVVYFPLDPWVDADKASANTDLRHNFRLSYSYELPIGKGQTFLPGLGGVTQAILGGWQLNSIIVAQSGFPLAMSMSSNQSGTALGNRPNRVCDGRLDDGTVAKWFDTACFAAPAVGTFGNAARTTLFGPGRWNVDLSVFKKFAVTENSSLQFRSEIFNLFNHAQFLPPSTSIGSPTAGRITQTAVSSRQVQFALKLVF